jgi:hypothetical protein
MSINAAEGDGGAAEGEGGAGVGEGEAPPPDAVQPETRDRARRKGLIRLARIAPASVLCAPGMTG